MHEHSVTNDERKRGIRDRRNEERRARDAAQFNEPRGETHAYENRRLESKNEIPTCTNSTVIVDVVSSDVNCPDRASTTSRKIPEVPARRTADNVINLHVIDVDRDVREKMRIDHVYEEVGTFQDPRITYEILNYRGNSVRTNCPVDTFVLPSHKICSHCAHGSRGSPIIYSDRLIRAKREINARETIFRQSELSSSQLCFGYRSSSSNLSLDERIDFMPVSILAKPNQSGILYSRSFVRDVFDLRISLQPHISLLDSDDGKIAETNTQIYHRFGSSCYSRLSRLGGQAPMIFPTVKPNRMFSTIKSHGCDENTIYWMNYDNDSKKHEDAKEQREEQQTSLSIGETLSNNRSSLLLLEPLLLMPELSTPRQNIAKNRITHSEHVKIVRMVIAYTLSFFLLAIITFYIVYFT